MSTETTVLQHEIAHLGHVELLTPEPEKSLWFFTEVLGLTESGRVGDSVYLRTWDNYEHHSLVLTAHHTSGIRRTALRAAGAEALKRRVAAIEAAGLGIGWTEGRPGIGDTYVFADPDGHEYELYWESEWFEAPEDSRPALKNQAQAYPGKGVCPRRLDHVNFLAATTEPNGAFVRDILGARVTEQIRLDNGTIGAQWLSFGPTGTSIRRLIVDADAAYPQREGITQDSWSRKRRPVTGIRPPASTSCSMSDTTSSGMICSLERATAERSRPSIAAATHVAATPVNSSRVALPSSTAGRVGGPLPRTTMAVAMAAWMTANVQNTKTLASR